jgi:diguanylate cyclase (GGDEF)-like protein
VSDAEQEIRRLRAQLSSLMAEAARNETISRRAQRRELLLLQSRSLEDLLENLVGGLQASFGLDAVSLALSDPEHEVHHLLLFSQQQRETSTEGVLLVDDLYTLCGQYTKLSGAILGPFDRAVHGKLFDVSAALGSVALVPLMLRGRLVGVLNLGSTDPGRFTREHATDFLSHLGLIAGFCLENAVNRARLTWSGLTDVLTGWHNRRYLNARVPEEVARARRLKSPLSLLMFDLDFFKKVNDQYGHLSGDAALRHVARRAQKQVRSSDVAARFGGEEFVIVLPDTDLSDARLLGERICDSVRSAPVPIEDEQHIDLTVSIGVARLDDSDGKDADTAATRLLARADEALFAAKSAGRNRVVARGGAGG